MKTSKSTWLVVAVMATTALGCAETTVQKSATAADQLHASAAPNAAGSAGAGDVGRERALGEDGVASVQGGAAGAHPSTEPDDGDPIALVGHPSSGWRAPSAPAPSQGGGAAPRGPTAPGGPVERSVAVAAVVREAPARDFSRVDSGRAIGGRSR